MSNKKSWLIKKYFNKEMEESYMNIQELLEKEFEEVKEPNETVMKTVNFEAFGGFCIGGCVDIGF